MKSAKSSQKHTNKNGRKAYYNANLKAVVSDQSIKVQRREERTFRSNLLVTYSAFRENRVCEINEQRVGKDTLPAANSFNNSSSSLHSNRTQQPIELLVTNLDVNMDQMCLKKELMNFFRKNDINVLHICVLTSQHFQQTAQTSTSNDFPSTCSVKAIVKVATQQDAQIAVSRLHRNKLGSKRIMISNMTSDRTQPLHILKSEVISIFENITSKKLPLVTFQDLYEERFRRSLSMAEIHRLREVIQLVTDSDGCGGRYVALNPGLKVKTNNLITSEMPTNQNTCCILHGQSNDSSNRWTEQDSLSLPSVKISLKALGPQIHMLLDTHGGSVPLNSLLNCYSCEIGKKFVYDEPPCVPLEHLISCVPGIEVSLLRALGFKRIQWLENKNEENSQVIRLDSKCGNVGNPAREEIAKQLSQFSREVKDLLKSQPHCLIAFSKFVPAYHNHFGRQCCVYQYGYTKLIELLEAIPHVVQILGDGTKRILTLTHREQTKRFAADLLKVLKAQPTKKLKLQQFPELYELVLEKQFDVTDYGVCYVTDILQDMWEGTVVMSQEADDIIVEIPKREQTPEEKERMKMFTKDVVELLQSTSTMAMSFSKFIPAYHHYFNRQCKVSDYGFSKLIELLEDITPDVIEIFVANGGEEKIIRLNFDYRLRTVGSRLYRIVKRAKEPIVIAELQNLFRHEYGFGINCEDFDVVDIKALIEKMTSLFEIVACDNQSFVNLVDDNVVQLIRAKILRILMETFDGDSDLQDLCAEYMKRFHQPLDVFVLMDRMNNNVSFDQKRKIVSLTPLSKFIRDCILSIQMAPNDFLTVRQLNDIHMRLFNCSLPQPKEFGFKTFVALFQSQSEFLSLVRRQSHGKNCWILTVNKNFLDEKLVVVKNGESEEGGHLSKSDVLKEIENIERSCQQLDVDARSTPVESPLNVPFPPCEWLRGNERKKLHRIAANFSLKSQD